MKNWRNLLHLLLGESVPTTQPTANPPPSLNSVLEQYEETLGMSSDDTHMLQSLLARDAVAATLQQIKEPSPAQIQQLAELDICLRLKVAGFRADSVDNWRQTLGRPDTAWWWFPSKLAEEREKHHDLPWMLLAGSFMTLTAALTLDIIKRLWDGAPDTISTIGTLLTLLLTASPLTKQGQDLGKVILQRISWLKPHWHSRAMLGASVIAFVMVLIARLLLPQLARMYNNWGLEELQVGNLTAAQQDFQRAVALTPDLVVPYQNVANNYQQIGLYDEALSWYQKAIEHDRNFSPAYRGLGHVYNRQGEFTKAEPVLLAGLALKSDAQNPELKKLETVTRYALLADLGWTYFEQERFERAQEVLEEAMKLESEVKAVGEQEGAEYRIALPHYYLAQIYEQLGRPTDAIQQWKDTLRFIGSNNWADREWIATAQQRLQQLENRKP
jgi:tetratricopeptide (TPR) repeat protein